jgi:methyl-accepting chemotaxis protein
MKDLPTYDKANPYPQNDPRYVAANEQLAALQTVVGVGENFSPYTYTLGPDGKLQWLTSWSAVNPNPPFTNQWRGSVADVFDGGENSEAYKLLAQGLTETVNQPQYTDDNGTWISTYTPIRDAEGKVIAGLAADFNIEYVDQVRTQAIRSILPLLLVGYLLLLALMFGISTWVTRPLKRLTAATEQIAAGNYDVELGEVVKTRWPDEMTVLARSFTAMVDKVRRRETTLKTEVKKLKVEIDAKKREQSVNEITDSDFFASISAKAASQRQRRTELDAIDEGPAATSAPAVETT